MNALAFRLETASQTPWPTDDVLLRVATSGSYVGFGDFNVDPTEPLPSAEDVRHAEGDERKLVLGILSGQITAFGQLRKNNPELAAKPSPSLEACRNLRQNVMQAATTADMVFALSQSSRSRLMVPVGFGSDTGWITVSPPFLSVAEPDVRAKLLDTTHDQEQTYRFYINPFVRDVPEVAAKLTLANEKPKAIFHFKFSEALDKGLYQRTDKIVVYARASEAGKVFELIQGVKKDVPRAFLGRRLPGLTYELEEGIGFAVDPLGQQSFTQAAVRVLDETKHRARETAGDLTRLPETETIRTMRDTLGSLATREGLNPINIAMPKDEPSR